MSHSEKTWHRPKQCIIWKEHEHVFVENMKATFLRHGKTSLRLKISWGARNLLSDWYKERCTFLCRKTGYRWFRFDATHRVLLSLFMRGNPRTTCCCRLCCSDFKKTRPWCMSDTSKLMLFWRITRVQQHFLRVRAT